MAQINESERRGDLTEAQAELARQNTINAAALDEANVRRLKAEAERLELTNPGSAEAQKARTDYEIALTRKMNTETDFDVSTEVVRRQKLEADRDKLLQDIEQGKREHDITFPSGEKVKVSTKEALDFYKSQLDALRGGDTGPTIQQRIQNQRQTREDEQRNQKEVADAENIIKTNPDKDTTAQHEIVNSRSNSPYVYVDRPKGITETFQSGESRSQKIPLPKRMGVDGKEKQYTAREVYDLYQTQFRGMTFKDFITYLYTNVAKQLPPKELR